MREELVRGQYFNVDKYLIEGEFEDETNKNFKILSILDGEGEIICDSDSYSIKREIHIHSSWIKDSLKGKVEILKSYL